MAAINMFRGGSPDFKAMFCGGDFAEFTPPFSSPLYDDTPPYNSHADGAQGQGYLNLWFPLVPNLQNNDAHKWMRNALEGVKAVGDIIRLAWVPLRSYAISQHFELVKGDELLDGVYVKPVAERVSWNFTTKSWDWTTNTDYAAAVTASGVTQFPLGIPSNTDRRWGFIDLSPSPKVSVTTSHPEEGTPTSSASVSFSAPCTFGHNLVKTDTDGVPVSGLDAYYGAVVLGLQIAAGQAKDIANIWRGNFALYMSAKLLQFECATQIG